MGSRIAVARVNDVKPGEGRVVDAGGRSLAVFNIEGRFYAIDNACPHRGGPLGEGEVEGCIVTCPWHGWRWDVTTGANANSPVLRVGTYPVGVEEGQVVVEVSG